MSDPSAKVQVTEYMTACYGTTEYTERMEGITLGVRAGGGEEAISYEYKDRKITKERAREVYAIVPQIETYVSMRTDAEAEGYVREGYAFSPMFHLGFVGEIGNEEEETTWLNLAKGN